MKFSFSCSRCGKQFEIQEEPAIDRVYRIPCKCDNTMLFRFESSRGKTTAPRPASSPPRTVPPPLPLGRPGVVSVQSRQAAFAPPPPRTAVDAAPPGGAGSPRTAAGIDAACLRDGFFLAQTSPEPQPEPFLTSAEFTLDPGSTGAPRHGLARRDQDASPEDVLEPTGPNWIPLEWAQETMRKRFLLSGCIGGAAVAFAVGVLSAAASTGSSSDVAAIPAPAACPSELAVAVTPPPGPPSRSPPRVDEPQVAIAKNVASPRAAPSSNRRNSESAGSVAARDKATGAEATVDAEAPADVETTPAATAPVATVADAPSATDAQATADAREEADAQATADAREEADAEPAGGEDGDDEEVLPETGDGASEQELASEGDEGAEGEAIAEPGTIARDANEDATDALETPGGDERADATSNSSDSAAVRVPASAPEPVATAKAPSR